MIVPKRFVSICARKSDIGVSSTDERLPYPALLTTTSREPKAPIAAFTAFAAADSPVTSSAMSLIWSPWRSDRSCRDSMPLAVANTSLPAARPASTIARPRPRELPVTNQTCAIHPPHAYRRGSFLESRDLAPGVALGQGKLDPSQGSKPPPNSLRQVSAGAAEAGEEFVGGGNVFGDLGA